MFRERMRKANKYVDLSFKDASENYLDEENLLKTFREQMKGEKCVKGKPLFPPRESEFSYHWKNAKNVKTHDGVEISKTGHLMGKSF